MPMRQTLTTLLVRDYDEAIGFYVGKVGLTLVEDADRGGGKRWDLIEPRPWSPRPAALGPGRRR